MAQRVFFKSADTRIQTEQHIQLTKCLTTWLTHWVSQARCYYRQGSQFHIVLAGQPVLKHLCFIPLKIPDYTGYSGEYRTYRPENKNRLVLHFRSSLPRRRSSASLVLTKMKINLYFFIAFLIFRLFEISPRKSRISFQRNTEK